MTASSTLTSISELAGKSKESWVSHAESAIATGEVTHAKLVLETLQHSGDAEIATGMMLVRACLHKDSYDSCTEAVSVSREALKNCNQGDKALASLACVVSLGALARQSSAPQEKKEALRKEALGILAAAPSPSGGLLDALLQYNWGVLLAETGDANGAVDKARSALEKSLSAKPHSSVLSPSPKDVTNNCLLLLALLLSARQQPDAALKVLSAVDVNASAASSMPSKSAVLKAQMLQGRLRSRLLFAQGSHASALSSMNQLKRQLSSSFGNELGAEGLKEEVVQAEASIWIDLSTLCIAQSQYEDAMFCVQHAAKAQPWSPATFHATGMVKEAAGQLDAACELFNDAISLDPRHGPSLNRLGTISRRRGSPSDLSLAKKLLLDAVRYEPDSAGHRYQLGMVAKEMGHRDECEAHMYAAVTLALSTPALPYSSLPLVLL